MRTLWVTAFFGFLVGCGQQYGSLAACLIACNGCCTASGECKSGTNDAACGSKSLCVQCENVKCVAGNLGGGGSCGGCRQSRCNGCCAATGECKSGTSNSQCGWAGEQCVSCDGAATCRSNGVGGGTCEGCSSSTCDGCCTASGECKAGTITSECGSNGSTCTACGGGASCRATVGGGTCEPCGQLNCKGCCAPTGECNSGTSNAACGFSGTTCSACGASSTCQATGVGGGSCR